MIRGMLVALRDRARGSDILAAPAAPAVEELAQLPRGFWPSHRTLIQEKHFTPISGVLMVLM